jgi:sulfate permease, SulP family
MPPITGLYSGILPTALYAFFGSSMQLTIGSTALISLMTGSLLTKYGVDWEEDYDLALDTAAQAAFCVGVLITILAFFNLGHLIHFIANPVMSGFTTGAALTIGLNQIKASVGFTQTPPQAGGEVEYNYEVMDWWKEHWDDLTPKGDHQCRNHYAVKICVGLYVPMMLITLFKWYTQPKNKEIKKKLWYRLYDFLTALMPLLAIIIGGVVAYQIKKADHFLSDDYQHSFYAKGLKIVGEVPSGVNILRIPSFRWPMGQFFADTVPVTLIAFMESYSIARNLAAQKNQLHTLSATQEMWGNGLGNLAACISSGYPVSGSFSRSALNAAAGARTPLARMITLTSLCIVLSSMTSALRFVPQAALSAVIFVAISNLINLSDIWKTWKHSKKDCLTIIVTIIFTFVYDTSVGLAVGIGCSCLMFLIVDLVLSANHEPRLFESSDHTATSTTSGMSTDQVVHVVRLESDINFLTAFKIKDFITSLAILIPNIPTSPSANWSEYYRHHISTFLDYYLQPNLPLGVKTLPQAIIIDLCIVKSIDYTGLETLTSICHELREKHVLVYLINIHPYVQESLTRFKIQNDESTKEINFEKYEKLYQMDLWSHGGPFRNAHHFHEVPRKQVGDVDEDTYSVISNERSRLQRAGDDDEEEGEVELTSCEKNI